MKTLLSVVIWMATVVGVGSIASAQQLNIDFGDDVLGLPSTYGAAAGQVGSWNDVGDLGLTSDLVGLSGSATDVDVTVTAANFNAILLAPTGNDQVLLNDALFDASDVGSWSIEFEDLDAGLYDVYVYAPNIDTISSTIGTGPFTVNGTAVADLLGATTLILNTSYAIVSGVSVSGAGTLTLASTGPGGSDFIGVSGIQLVSVPEPSSLALFSAGALGLLGYGRQRRKKTA